MRSLKRAASVVGLLVATLAAAPGRADVVVSIAPGAGEDVWFWVETKGSYARLHEGRSERIDARLLRPGDSARIRVAVVNPLTFSHVFAAAYHPEYLYESRLVRETPSAFSTVEVPPFVPRSWRAHMDAGEPVRRSGPGVHLQSVIDHLRLFSRHYVPAIDEAGTAASPARYIPLFEELIAYARRTLPLAGYGSPSVEERRRKDPEYARRLEETERRRLEELDRLLGQIRALTGLSAEQRIRLRSLQARLNSARALYQEQMSAGDRRVIAEFLEFQFEKARARPAPERTRRWSDGETGLVYAITVRSRYSLSKDGRRLYDTCYETSLGVDLLGGVKTDLDETRRDFRANFCRSGVNEWLIQLPGG